MSEPDDPAADVDVLLQRALAELEQGWADGPGPSVEELLGRFPQLKGIPQAVCRLIDAESRQRIQRGEKPEPDEYHRRFPELVDALRELLTHDSAPAELFCRPTPPVEPPGLMLALKLRCPHCRNPIEVVDEVSVESDISCPSCGSSFRLASAEQTLTYRPEKGATVGHFELTEKVGAGAFGSVWKARDTELQRTVAVKIPRASGLDADDLDRFLREARAAAQLRHPNIVSVYEVGRDDQTSYIASEFIDGLTLADWLTGQRLSIREAVELCATMAEALHHAHTAGIIHRDLKPGNIMLDQEGRPHLMDFGLAKRDAGEITMTIDGHILGTPAYMSPEQAKGDSHRADRRSDIYSLGAVLFELLTGERPFRGNSRMLIHQVIHEEAPSPRKLNGAVPRDLETICLKCLEKEPGKRFQSTQDLAEELRRWLHGEPIRSRPLGTAARVWRWSKRKPAQAAALLLLLLLTVGSLSAAIVFYDMQQTQKRLAGEKDDETRRALDAVNQKDQALTERLAAVEREQAAKSRLSRYQGAFTTRLTQDLLTAGRHGEAKELLESTSEGNTSWTVAYLNRVLEGKQVQFASSNLPAVAGIWTDNDGTLMVVLKSGEIFKADKSGTDLELVHSGPSIRDLERVGEPFCYLPNGELIVAKGDNLQVTVLDSQVPKWVYLGPGVKATRLCPLRDRILIETQAQGIVELSDQEMRANLALNPWDATSQRIAQELVDELKKLTCDGALPVTMAEDSYSMELLPELWNTMFAAGVVPVPDQHDRRGISPPWSHDVGRITGDQFGYIQLAVEPVSMRHESLRHVHIDGVRVRIVNSTGLTMSTKDFPVSATFLHERSPRGSFKTP